MDVSYTTTRDLAWKWKWPGGKTESGDAVLDPAGLCPHGVWKAEIERCDGCVKDAVSSLEDLK